MYQVTLTESCFPAQDDAQIRDITTGALLREIADYHPDAIALVEIDEGQNQGGQWTYRELLAESERLATSLATRFNSSERVGIEGAGEFSAGAGRGGVKRDG